MRNLVLALCLAGVASSASAWQQEVITPLYDDVLLVCSQNNPHDAFYIEFSPGKSFLSIEKTLDRAAQPFLNVTIPLQDMGNGTYKGTYKYHNTISWSQYNNQLVDESITYTIEPYNLYQGHRQSDGPNIYITEDWKREAKNMGPDIFGFDWFTTEVTSSEHYVGCQKATEYQETLYGPRS